MEQIDSGSLEDLEEPAPAVKVQQHGRHDK